MDAMFQLRMLIWFMFAIYGLAWVVAFGFVVLIAVRVFNNVRRKL